MAGILSAALSKVTFVQQTDELIGDMLTELNKALNASSSTFWKYDKLTGLLALAITCINDGGRFLIQHETGEADFPTVFSVKRYRTTRRLYFAGKPFVQVIDLEDDDLRDHGKWLQSIGVKAVLQLPVILHKDFVGWIPVHSTVSEDPWNEADIKKASEIVNDLAIGLRFKELTAQAEETAILEERANLARDIHDTLAQGFLGIILQHEAAQAFYGKDEGRYQKHFDQIRKLAETSLDDARRSIRSLRLPALASQGLATMIRRHAMTMYENAPIYIEERGKFPEIRQEAKYEVYRVICEALSNAVRHAQASEINIIFSAAPELEIQVHDNGIGMSQYAKGNDSFGVDIIHERAEKIGAQVALSDNSAGGTTVILTIPPVHALRSL